MKKFTLFLLFLMGAYFASAQGTYTFNWVPTTISPDNNILGMNIYDDNSAVVAGLNGTFFKLDPTNNSWSAIPIQKGSYDFVDISINSNGIGYAVSGKSKCVDNPSGGDEDIYGPGALLKTTDNGQTWTLIDPSVIGTGDDPALNPSAPGCYALNYYSVESINDTTALVGVAWYDLTTGSKESHSTILETTDGGTTWAAITEDRGSHYPMSIRSFDGTAYMGGNTFLLKSGDGTVTDLYPNMYAADNSDSTMFVYNVAVVSADEIYVTTTSNGIFKSVDGGATFTKLADITGGYVTYKVNDSTLFVASSSSKTKVSTDGGTTWEVVSPGSTLYTIGGVLNDSLYGLGKSSVYKIALTDLASHTSTWVTQTLSDGNNLRGMTVIDDNNAIVVGYADTFMATSDKGSNWSAVTLPDLTAFAPKFDFNGLSTHNGASYLSARRYKLLDYPSSSSNDDYYVNGLIYRSYDNWATWTLLDLTNVGSGDDPSTNPSLDGCFSVDAYTVGSIDSTSALAYLDWYDTLTGSKVTHSRVFRTTDGGDTWDTVTGDLGSSFVTEIKCINDNLLYILGNKIFLKSTDGGATLTDLYPTLAVDTDSSLYLKQLDYISSDEYYVVTISDGIFKTTDGGTTYTLMNAKTGANAIYKVNDSSYVTASTTTKTLFTHDGGANWESCTPGTTLWGFGGVLNDSLVGLAKGDIYKIALSDFLPQSGVGIRDINTENPLRISYRPSSIEVFSPNENIDKCVVYSITGRVVNTFTPASKSCVINYSSYAPGIYIVSTSVANKRYTNKVIFK